MITCKEEVPEGSSSTADDADLSSNDSSDCPFYFESDHVALKGNFDYQELLKTVTLLEAQRVRAVKDLDKLLDLKEQAVKDPLQFVEKLQNRIDIGIPQPQNIARLPSIQWDKYATSLDQASFRKHVTRGKQLVINPLLGKKASGAPSTLSPSAADMTVVRGRVKGTAKPETFNQLWTSEEQRRLEELLVEFPPEEVEARRFQKIADALGNRTYHQVASRIQKYFIKLAKAGLPVPGRIPNLTNHHSKSKGPRRHHRYSQLYASATSTMLQSYTPPVFMADHEDDDESVLAQSSASAAAMAALSLTPANHRDNSAGTSCSMTSSAAAIDDMEGIPDELRNTDEYAELVCLQSLRKQTLSAACAAMPFRAVGKCYCCNDRLSTATVWQCISCLEEERGLVYVCPDCHRKQLSAHGHDVSHTVIQIDNVDEANADLDGSRSFVDRDYVASNFNIPGCNNYLDPNYLPAT